ncbi:NUDIX family hydrolase [Candidatus Arthromitus sp. SFB-mouse-Japan]|jgi:NTP pyrophosphohydrolases including oxidative damage repair enzymes|uniref:NUDIX hydrolase n=1 Tax=unclassified Candidatus Neoarthromitus TaxID=2638829 RepID=UPI00021B7F33|nr:MULTISPECIES: NUDIX hydrolase [unclassified Candidatus Arthromitus]EIA24075.1 NUDIX hydrolase [Candidatus Arthromitus sp. SFB-1]EIA25351.1 Putative hydrolase [Candidatus Arthromitus sp. SFB-4]EIA29920.1 NUDIX hydrolase [Candidatus Arthromitus sp. SFB-mouse-SU]AID45110.1 ADP-ribose pyrophosphatase [Candidatus Arthromitus sp. SFB-mouse-NL]EGX28421.1 ADP-ribose diphosphatase [Candidatus Arthromitus sp. SFB-mouse-NYU]
MDLFEKTLFKKEIYNGNFFTVEKLSVLLPDGNTSTRDIVRHCGAVAIIAVTQDEKILFVEQFRKPVDKVLLEIPAGKLELNEDPLRCAIRELEEETGYTSSDVEFLGKVAMTPGFCDEVMHFYFAKNLNVGVKGGDEDEFINVCEFTLDEVNLMISRGEILDSKTISGIKLFEIMKK